MASRLTEEVVDFTGNSDDDHDEEGRGAIRLRSGIDVRQLGSGVMLEIDPDLALEQERADESDYFQNVNQQELETMLSKLQLEMEEDDCALEEDNESETEGELSRFQKLARKMDYLVADGGVKKRILKSGLVTEGVVPKNGTVIIHYSLYLEDQLEPYDSSNLRGKAERYKMGAGSLIVGMELSINSMRKKEKSEFLISPAYAFGPMGCPPRVPGNATILAKIEVLDFMDETEADALLSIPIEDRYRSKTYDEIESAVKKEHVEGNKLVGMSEYKMAARRYETGIRLLEDAQLQNDEEERRQKHLLLKLYLNRAHCLNKTHRPRGACLDLQKALSMDSVNVKALYRMGVAKRFLGNNGEALKYLRRAQNLAPNDPNIGHELLSLEREMRKDVERERAFCQKIFGGSRTSDDDEKLLGKAQLPDEFYSELSAQMKGFLGSPTRDSWPLPSSLNKIEMAVVRKMAITNGLVVLEAKEGGNRRVWMEKKEQA